MLQKFNHFSTGETDSVLSQRPLLYSLPPILLLIAGYLYFVLRAGPRFMEHRPAYNLKYLLLVYNLLQVFTNFGIFIYGMFKFLSYRSTVSDFGCILSFPMDHPLKQMEIRYFYVYFLIKILDLLDTVFFVLRKSIKQISFLHVYHHVMMVLFNYYYLQYYGTGGHLISIGALNTIVHGFMYAYYFATALQPNMKTALRWKRHVTHLQLLQFALIFWHQLYPLIYRPQCKFPRFLLVFGALQAAHMMWLFGNFYWETYIRRKMKSMHQHLGPKPTSKANSNLKLA